MQAKSPYISLIIPVYNTGAYLRECIDSIIAQPFKDYELILVDDGPLMKARKLNHITPEKYDNISVLHSNSVVCLLQGIWVLHMQSVNTSSLLIPMTICCGRTQYTSSGIIKIPRCRFYPGAILSTVEWNNYKPGQNVSMC